MGRDIVKWTDPLWSKVSPQSFPTYFAQFPVSDQFAQKISKLAQGASLIVGYGSQFSRETGRPSAMRDIMFFVSDPRVFHSHNTQVRRSDYGMGPTAALHTSLNRLGMNFYKTDVDGPVKYGVMGIDDMAHHVGFGGPDDQYTPIDNLYVPGRNQKRLVSLGQAEGSGLKTVLEAINKARIDGVTLALSRTKPEQAISLQDLAYGVSRLSYDGDVRFENPRKAQNQVDANWGDWQAMLLPIVDQMLEQGIVERSEQGRYLAKIVIPSSTINSLILRSQAFAFGSNYFKNWATFGPVRGFAYAANKVMRNFPKNDRIAPVSG